MTITDGEQGQAGVLVVEFHGTEPSELDSIIRQHGSELVAIRAKNFDAAAYTVQVVCTIVSGGALTALVAVVRAHIESRQHITIKADGIELQGLGARDAVEVLERLRPTLPPALDGE